MNKEEKDNGQNPPVNGREPLTEAERIRRRKLVTYTLMGLIFLVAMWLIFGTTGHQRQ